MKTIKNASYFWDIFKRLLLFLLRSYKTHWFATPAGILAALVSTISTATLMVFVSPHLHNNFGRGSAIIINAIVAPLLAYAIYLSVYYYMMFLRERNSLQTSDKLLDEKKFKEWLRVVKYDYLAHVPSDIYLISSAALIQASFEASGFSIFMAVIMSQFIDDFITFLKEPAIWSGAKEIVAWESRTNKTLSQRVADKLQS